MLVPLHHHSAPARPREAFHLLLECHERIRAFTDLALKVARLPNAPVAERVEVFTRVERYFTEVFPLHVEDEDVSLAHRLWEVGPSREVLEALEDMTRQHRELDALMETLVARWRLLRTSPERHEAVLPGLVRDTERFSRGMEAHLWLEECVLFPEARAKLSVGSVRALGAEMRARRCPKS